MEIKIDYPGEKLLLKMWETLTEKGIAALLRPWQMRREGRAAIDVRKEGLLALAQAEHDAEEIRAGRRELGVGGRTLAPARVTALEGRTPDTLAAIEAKVTAGVISQEIRKEVNVGKAVLAAEAELADDVQEPPDRKVDGDWLHRWREGASAVSTEELQNLWGRLLAGEVKSPGTFSLRTLDFLRNLSTHEAMNIAKLARFVIQGWILRDDAVLARDGIKLTLIFLLSMQELGVVGSVEGLGLEVNMTSLDKTTFLLSLTSNGRVLIVNHPDPNKKIVLPIYQVTSLGQQLFNLGKFEPHDDYLRAVGQKICEQGFEVSIGDYEMVDEKSIRYSNAVAICTQNFPTAASGSVS